MAQELPPGFVLDSPAPQGVLVGAPPKPDKPEAPKTTWTPITPEQASARGLDPKKTWQISSEGKVEPIGDSGNVISDQDKADLKTEALTKLKLIKSLGERSRNGWFATGFGATTAGSIPGTTAYDVKNDTATVSNSGALQRIMEMAKTNGGKNPLTPLSNSDFQALSQSVSNLDPAQSDEQYQRNLGVYKDIFTRAYIAAGGDPKDVDAIFAAQTQDNSPAPVGAIPAGGNHPPSGGNQPPNGGGNPFTGLPGRSEGGASDTIGEDPRFAGKRYNEAGQEDPNGNFNAYGQYRDFRAMQAPSDGPLEASVTGFEGQPQESLDNWTNWTDKQGRTRGPDGSVLSGWMGPGQGGSYENVLQQELQRQGKGDPTSAENYTARGVNGALFSLSDELNGALAAAKYGIQGGDPALAYQLGRDLERSRQQQNEQGQGLTGTALEIVPSLLTGNLLGDAKGVQGAMKIGAKGGALYGFGSGQGLGDSINRASTGGVIGGALGAGVNQVGEKVIAPGFNALSQSRLGRGVASAFNRAGTSADEATAAITPAELIAAGKENNVRVMTSDVLPPTTAVGRTARMIGENIPLIGTAGNRAAQQAERTAAVSRFAKEFEAEGGTVDGVTKDLLKTRGKQIENLTTAKNSVIESVPGTVQATNTLAALDGKIAELNARNTAVSRELAAKLRAMRPDFEGKTLSQLEAMRTDELSSAFKSDSLAHLKDLGEKTIRSLYTPLKEDMGAFIKANGKPGDFNKWSNANKKLSDMMGDLKSSKFKSTLNNGATTPEEAGKLLFSQTPSDVQRLVKELSPVGQAKARSAVIAKAVSQSIDPNTGNVSPDKFLTAINALKPSTSALFKGEHGERLDGLVKLLSGTKRAAAANTETVTGMQGARLSVAGVAVTNPKIGITAGVLARAYESPVVRNLLVRLGKARAGSPAEEATRNRLLDIITRMASQRLPEAANDTIGAAFGQSPGRAAAQDETNGRREPPAQ